MKRHLFMLGLLFAAPTFAGSTTHDTQDASQGARRPPPFERKSPVQLLIDHRQDLALTDAQAASLTRIQTALDAKNAPVKQSLEALRPSAPPDRNTQAAPSAQDQARHEQARGLFEQLRANGLAAYQEAEQVLTDAQKTQARTLLESERRAHGPGHGGRGGPPRGE
ncbi:MULTISPECIES: Spy/CpxP family protein refolding chaperone [unclassified Corallococcus]|uniref:Spy/CpxP family protein refolding chaperone n=1 Tax=unclassified Corallococcus TaxID=2685029 RepID=UPI001A8E62DB|nr:MULTISPECIES: Spy/CpxP family protein refolding chaperone [unclassified Corallococcus]MBN9687088.1 Spy/CpxP family protein refolding chaperone [Corallococcus sp. NCSPR001]WAS89083.1 Spy/CpxP family protein refolding chaperone [Corallococcus sp. NCRR]